MKSLIDIYNKYITTEKIEDDPKIGAVIDALREVTDEDDRDMVIRNICTRSYNEDGFRKLWKPGLPMINLDFEIFTIENLLYLNQDLAILVFSEMLEDSGLDEVEVFRNIYISSYKYRQKYEKYYFSYYSYISRFEVYVYKIPNLKCINEEKPIIYRGFLDSSGEGYHIDTKSGSKFRFDLDLKNYGLAFSREMVKEQFKVLKENHMRDLFSHLSYLRKEVNRSEKELKKIKDQLNETIDTCLIDDSRLDELFKI